MAGRYGRGDLAARILEALLAAGKDPDDLTEEYCRAGEVLTACTGLGDHLDIRHGNALEMPYRDASFDVAWAQHSSMNIADKERLYVEIHRALSPGGRLALYEIMAGPTSPIRFPVPSARDPSISDLRAPETIRSLIATTGFKVLAWVDETA